MAHEAQNKAVDGLSHIQSAVVLNEKRLQRVVVEGFVAEFDILVADVGKHCGMRMQVLVETGFRHYATFNVAKKTARHYAKLESKIFGLT